MGRFSAQAKAVSEAQASNNLQGINSVYGTHDLEIENVIDKQWQKDKSVTFLVTEAKVVETSAPERNADGEPNPKPGDRVCFFRDFVGRHSSHHARDVKGFLRACAVGLTVAQGKSVEDAVLENADLTEEDVEELMEGVIADKSAAAGMVLRLQITKNSNGYPKYKWTFVR